MLAGGGSIRMGRPKAALEWHGSTLLRRVAGLVLSGVDGPVVVVRARGQELPDLPERFEIATDATVDRGPVAGLAAGLAALDSRVERVFVAATDMPLLHPAFVRAVTAGVTDEVQLAVPSLFGRDHLLAAAYRADVAELVARNLAVGRIRLSSLLDECRVAHLDAEVLLGDPDVADLDPDLRSVENLNTEAEYTAALDRPEPDVRVTDARVGAAPVPLRASALGAAAAAIGRQLDATVTVHLNGRAVDPDPELPLAVGDEVTFR